MSMCKKEVHPVCLLNITLLMCKSKGGPFTYKMQVKAMHGFHSLYISRGHTPLNTVHPVLSD